MYHKYYHDPITAEDRTVILMSIRSILYSGVAHISKEKELEMLHKEMQKKHPRIIMHDIPVIYQSVRDFYYCLIYEKQEEGDNTFSRNVIEMIQHTKRLIERLVDYSEAYSIDLTDSLFH